MTHKRNFLKRLNIKNPWVYVGGVAILLGISVWFFVALNINAASPSSLQAESGSRTTNANLVNDASASGGQAIKFTNNDTCETVGPGGYQLPNLVGYANSCNTGARQACTSTHVGTFSTSSNGQVIENLCIQGTLRINHDNVTVRDVKIAPTSPVTYIVDIGRNFQNLHTSPACPVGLNVEYTTIDYSAVGETDWGVYQRCHPKTGVHRFDHVKIENVGRGMLMGSDPCSTTTTDGVCSGELNLDYVGGNMEVTNSYIYAQYTTASSHRSAISTHGGNNYTVSGNTFICAGSQCSSSANLYHDYWAVSNYTFQNNVVAGGSICVRADISDPNLAAFGHLINNIKILNNRFSTVYAPQCGSLQALIFYGASPGSTRSGNVWHETGTPITGE